MADRIVLNTISYHGYGAIGNIVPELTNRGYRKAFVATDPDLIRFGVTKKVTDLMEKAGFAYEIFSHYDEGNAGGSDVLLGTGIDKAEL